MSLLLSLASLLGFEVEDLVERFKKDAVAWSVVAFFAVVGLLFLLVALHAWLSLAIGPIWAPLTIGGASLVLALAVFLAIRISSGIAERQVAERRHSAERTALVTTAALTALPMVMNSDLMKKVGIPIGGALAAAYLLSKPSGSRGRHNSAD